MKPPTLYTHLSSLLKIALLAALLSALTVSTFGHDLSDPDQRHRPHYDYTIKPPMAIIELGARPSDIEKDILAILFAVDRSPFFEPVRDESLTLSEQNDLAVAIAEIFRPFAPNVRVRWDKDYFYVESDGFPNHRMMAGITAWQQQVPIPQKYYGDNAWRFPLEPIVAKLPLSAKDHFFRGAIAIAANGVPIFNPIKNDGHTDTFLAGELDEYGGHAGRADDYHYHIAPLHLQDVVGKGKPIAYALDGYPIIGLTEPDGSPVGKLDMFNGHSVANGKYHYHASKTYPYINGGFHGEVTDRDGQVDPQPRAKGVRPSTQPLRGAKISNFVVNKDGSIDLTYTVNSEMLRINYKIQKDGSYRFEFFDSTGKSRVENFSGNVRGGGEEPPVREDNPGENRVPWIIQHANEMDSNKDGSLTRAEMNGEINGTFLKYDVNGNGKLESGEVQNGNVRSPLGGFVKQHAKEIDSDSNSLITPEELTATVSRMFDRADRDRNGILSKDELGDATPLDAPRKKN